MDTRLSTLSPKATISPKIGKAILLPLGEGSMKGAVKTKYSSADRPRVVVMAASLVSVETIS
jgi:hypothetical protein